MRQFVARPDGQSVDSATLEGVGDEWFCCDASYEAMYGESYLNGFDILL